MTCVSSYSFQTRKQKPFHLRNSAAYGRNYDSVEPRPVGGHCQGLQSHSLNRGDGPRGRQLKRPPGTWVVELDLDIPLLIGDVRVAGAPFPDDREPAIGGVTDGRSRFPEHCPENGRIFWTKVGR
jgi:hypothetical protein